MAVHIDMGAAMQYVEPCRFLLRHCAAAPRLSLSVKPSTHPDSNRRFVMTNINCNANCVYQQDGKCCYDNVMPQTSCIKNATGSSCAYQLTAEQAKVQGVTPAVQR